MIEKLCKIIGAALIILFIAYIILMAYMESPIYVDLTNNVQLFIEDQMIKLPGYLDVFAEYYGKRDGVDTEGKQYTEFFYLAPDVFEDVEIICFVCWDNQTVKTLIGQSRGMDLVIDDLFPTVQWDRMFQGTLLSSS